MEIIDWGFVFTVGGFIVGVIAIFLGVKKMTMYISPKTKLGNIDMSGSKYTIEEHNHYRKDTKKKKHKY